MNVLFNSFLEPSVLHLDFMCLFGHFW